MMHGIRRRQLNSIIEFYDITFPVSRLFWFIEIVQSIGFCFFLVEASSKRCVVTAVVFRLSFNFVSFI